jgi:hypothetical protein
MPEYIVLIFKFIVMFVALVVALLGNTNALDFLKGQYKKYLHRDLPINIYVLGAVQLASGLLTIALIPSIYRSFYPDSGPPSSSTHCTMQRDFEKAKADGADALKKIILGCESTGGTLVAQAKIDLEIAEEAVETDKARRCLQRVSSSSKECGVEDLKLCLIDYALHSKSRNYLEEFRTTVQRESDSDRCKTSLPSPPCSDKMTLAKATNSGVDGLRNFIKECQQEGGLLVEQAKAELKQADSDAYRSSSSCIEALSRSSSCSSEAFARCVSGYATVFPSGDRLNDLTSVMQSELASSRCKPTPEKHDAPIIPPPPKEAELTCFAFNGQRECIKPIAVNYGTVSGKTVAFFYKVAHCNSNPSATRRVSAGGDRFSGRLYVGQNGRAYLFYANPKDAGISVGINVGKEAGFTLRDLSSIIGGRRVTEEHRVPVVATARIEKSDLFFSYSWEFRSSWPSGEAMTDRRVDSFHIKILSDAKCSLLERTFRHVQTTGGAIDEDYRCGPAVVDESCSITDQQP